MNKKIFTFFGVFFFLLFVYNALTFQRIGIRGSDHYWYVSATQSLISGDGVRTNHFYPVKAIKYRYEERKGFVHNIPQVYLAAVPGFLVGSFNGWIFLNTFSYIISLFLYYQVLKKLIPKYLAVFGLSLVLIFPISLWLVPQPLSEPFLSLLISGVLYTYFVFPARLIHFKYIIISLLIILLVLGRSNFLLLFPLIPVAYFMEMGKNKKSYIGSLMFLILPFLLYDFIGNYFPGVSEGSLKAVLLYYSETDSPPMLGFFGQPIEELSGWETITRFYQKAIKGFETQFFQPNLHFILFFLPFNILIIANIILFLTAKDKTDKKPLIITLLVFFLHISTAIVFQNQFRYLLPYYPLLFFAFLYQLRYTNIFQKIDNSLKKTMNIATFYGATLIFIIGIIFGLKYIHESTKREALEYAHHRESLASFVNENTPVNENIWSELHGSITGFALQPRGVLYGGMDFFSNQEVKIIIENADVNWLLATKESSLPKRLSQMGFRPDSVSLHRIELFDTSSELILYRLNPE